MFTLSIFVFASPDHHSFLHSSYGENLKMKLYQHYSNLNVVFRSKKDNQERVIVNQGVLVTPLDPQLEGRLTVDGSVLVLKKIHSTDEGVFKVTDLAGFSVADIYISVEGNEDVFYQFLEKPHFDLIVMMMAGSESFSCGRSNNHESLWSNKKKITFALWFRKKLFFKQCC